jgi:hypothetical protein
MNLAVMSNSQLRRVARSAISDNQRMAEYADRLQTTTNAIGAALREEIAFLEQAWMKLPREKQLISRLKELLS